MLLDLLILIHYIFFSLSLFRTNTQILLGLLKFCQLALFDQQLLLELDVALEEVVVLVLEVGEEGFLLVHSFFDDGQVFVYLLGLFVLLEELGLEFVHFAVSVE